MVEKRVAKKWQEFEFLVMPPGASHVQRQEMRRSFYGGCEALLKIMVDDAATLPDEGAEKVLEEVQEELKEFGAAIQRGKA